MDMLTIIVDWKEGVDVEDVAAGSAMYYAGNPSKRPGEFRPGEFLRPPGEFRRPPGEFRPGEFVPVVGLCNVGPRVTTRTLMVSWRRRHHTAHQRFGWRTSYRRPSHGNRSYPPGNRCTCVFCSVLFQRSAVPGRPASPHTIHSPNNHRNRNAQRSGVFDL